MFPLLSDLINYLFGTHLTLPVQSYGFTLAISFLCAAFILNHELKRLEKENKIPTRERQNLNGAKDTNRPVPAKTIKHPYELTINFTIIALVFGIAGSKVFDMIEHINELFRDPFGMIFSFSGLSFYGGLIFAGFALAWYARRNNIGIPFMADAVAPALIFAYATGRIGCQLAGDGCWGVFNMQPKPAWLGFLPDWMWGFRFPHNVINEGILIPGCGGDHCFILQYPVFPTSFYETILGLLIFLILWNIRKRISVPGYLFSLYLVLNGAERYFIEKIRVNRIYPVLGMHLTQAEIIALVLIVLGFAGFWFFKRLENKRET